MTAWRYTPFSSDNFTMDMNVVHQQRQQQDRFLLSPSKAGGPFERQSTLHDFLSPRARRQRAAELEDEDAPSPRALSEQAGRVYHASHAPSPQALSQASRQRAVSDHDTPPQAPSEQAGSFYAACDILILSSDWAGRQGFCLIPCSLALGPHQASRQGAVCSIAIMAARAVDPGLWHTALSD